MDKEHFNIIEKIKISVIENENAIGKMIDYEEIKRLNRKYFPNLIVWNIEINYVLFLI